MNYLLLRSNKQSGPYSFEQLIKFGLKPYDLIWIESKSAAWRYPSELPELKDYAPTVEEQPYDRFYKKAPEEKHFFESQQVPKQEINQPSEVKKQETKQYDIPVIQKPEIQKQYDDYKPVEIKHAETPNPEKSPVVIPAETVEIKYEAPIPEQKPAIQVPQEVQKPVEINHYEYPATEKIMDGPVEEEQPPQVLYQEIPVEQKQEFHLPAATVGNGTTADKKSSGKVFVSMPVNSTNRPVMKTILPVIPIVPETRIEEFSEKQQVPQKSIQVLQKSMLDEKAELKEEYSQSLDEIKRMYTETYLQRKQKASRKQALSKFFQVAGIAACAIGVAAFVYFVFLADNNPTNLASLTQLEQGNLPENSSSSQAIEKKDTKKYAKVDNKIIRENNIPAAADRDEREAEELLKQMEEIKIPDTNDDVEEITTVENYPAGKSETDPATGQRTKATRNSSGKQRVSGKEPEEDFTIKTTAVINRFVSVKANEYKRKAFGGIQDLQVTVSNKSKFILDKVIVELEYLKPSEQLLKKEKIELNDIAPNGTMTVKIPDSQRGIKVNCKIIEVESSQFDKHLAGM